MIDDGSYWFLLTVWVVLTTIDALFLLDALRNRWYGWVFLFLALILYNAIFGFYGLLR